MHSAATQSALHFHVTQILIENPRQHLTTQPVGNIQHRFLSRHCAPTRHIVPFAVLGWDILILLKKIACHRETNPPLSPPFWRYAYACAMVFMTRILSFETDYPRVSRNPTRWSRGTKTLGTRLVFCKPRPGKAAAYFLSYKWGYGPTVIDHLRKSVVDKHLDHSFGMLAVSFQLL